MWDQRYDVPEYIFGEAPCEWLTMNAHRLPTSGNALSLGDGDGRNGVYLAECGLSVTSVDLSSVGLAKAERLAVSRGVSITTVCADLRDYKIKPESLDLIVSIYCHLPENPTGCRLESGGWHAGVQRSSPRLCDFKRGTHIGHETAHR